MKIVLSIFFFISFSFNSFSQIQGNIVFWSAQQWECEFMKIDLYDLDTNIIYSGKLSDVYKGFDVPDCGNQNTLSVQNIDTGRYFFVADCTRDQCGLCGGEGSYWQPIVHNETAKQKGTRNKGNIEGTWKTCYLCDGNGHASTILWIDTLSVQFDRCRSVLLK